MEPFVVGLFLSVTNQKIVDYLAAPFRAKFPDYDFWWLLYVALATGAAIAWFAEINLFGAYVSNVLLSRVLSCVLVGGGSSLIHDIFNNGNVTAKVRK